VIFHDVAAGVALDRLKKQAEDKQRHLTLDRLKNEAEDKQKFESWLNEQRGPVSPWFQKQNEERKKRAEEERNRAREEPLKTGDPAGTGQLTEHPDSLTPGERLLRDAKTLEDRLNKQAEDERKGGLLAKHHDIVYKFLDIAERKVSVLDEYGDENWGALPEEIHKCMTKIAAREKWIDISKASPSSPLKKLLGGYMTPIARSLAESLDSEFRIYHEAHKELPNNAKDFRTLKNIEFETYVRRWLEGAGYTVVGTRATGDQGADLIAKRNGRTIAIQAKGYTGTVGNSAVQEIIGALRVYNADEGWVVTNSTFTRSARELAHANKIRLIDGHGLTNSLP
jgi:hypothetical protein